MKAKTLSTKTDHFQSFQSDISSYSLPNKLNFPFYYDPHPLCELAATEIQEYITHQDQWLHNFGLDDTKEGLIIGKMFGVLLVQRQDGTIGYLAAFSGKLAESNHIERFVPTVYDMLTKDGHFKSEEVLLNAFNSELESLEINPDYVVTKQLLDEAKKAADAEISNIKSAKKESKKNRKALRTNIDDLSENERVELFERLRIESIKSNYYLKDKIAEWDKKITDLQNRVSKYQNRIDELRKLRKEKSNQLQQYLFKQYRFLNQAKEEKSLLDIFDTAFGIMPPAGAGECAAPKLFHYAFSHDLKPLAIAEFWWGASPKSAIRKHKQFYPACRGKCEPILAHMLEGIEMADNPMLSNPAEGKKLSILFEDDAIVIVNKPHEFLSVPGKNIEDSVWLRMKDRLRIATGPLIVHRLDMSTSGLMIIAKSKEAHKILQRQFIKRTVEKRYVALLEGILPQSEGTIELPLRVDLDNRPHQLVCHDHGKYAKTEYELIEQFENFSKVYFYPKTGRTHQLRVHAAHQDGLNMPIKGDDLYGNKGKRLHLHAEYIKFIHPLTKAQVEFQIDADF